MAGPVHYDTTLKARVPREFPKLVSTAAAKALISPAAYVRRAVADALARDGYVPPSAASAEPRKAA